MKRIFDFCGSGLAVAVFISAMSSVTPAAQAATLVTDGDVVTGVTDLSIGDTVYDLSWVEGSAADAYGAFPGVFPIGTAAGAKLVVSFLNVLFDDGAFPSTYTRVRAGSTDYGSYRFGYDSRDTGGEQVLFQEANYSGDFWLGPFEGNELYSSVSPVPYAVLTATGGSVPPGGPDVPAVPLPASAFLLMGGLAGLAGMRRRARRKA